MRGWGESFEVVTGETSLVLLQRKQPSSGSDKIGGWGGMTRGDFFGCI